MAHLQKSSPSKPSQSSPPTNNPASATKVHPASSSRKGSRANKDDAPIESKSSPPRTQITRLKLTLSNIATYKKHKKDKRHKIGHQELGTTPSTILSPADSNPEASAAPDMSVAKSVVSRASRTLSKPNSDQDHPTVILPSMRKSPTKR
ncbi:hypothetical protein BGX23_012530 [Mortierella sp. AD031]|nr:hypothetical protein BGX23_012530 [Mortierella sp. AD031]